MTSLDPRKVVLREGLSPDFVALMTPDPTPSAHILRPLEHLTGCGESGGDGRTFQESFHIMCQGQSLDGKGCRSQTKEAKTKEGKAEEDIGEPFKNQAIKAGPTAR